MAVAQSLAAPTPLQVAYDVSADGEIDLDPTRGAIKFDGAGLAAGVAGTAGPNFMEVRRGTGLGTHVLTTAHNATDARTTIYSSSLNGIDLSPDPAVFPNEPIISLSRNHLEFLRTDRTFLSNAFANLFGLNSTLTLDFVNATLGAFVLFSPTVVYQQSANPFGMANLFNAGGTLTNPNGLIRNLTVGLTFVGQLRFRADGAAIGMTQLISFLEQSQLITINGGSGTLSVNYRQFIARGVLGTGWTSDADRVGFTCSNVTITGVLNAEHIGFEVADLTAGVNGATGFLSRVNAAIDKRAFNARGTAESDFGGTVNLTGGALLNYGVADALGGGAPATLGTIGGTGPTAAAQLEWLRVESGGVTRWIPAWA